MSDGPRIPLARAVAAAQMVMQLWGMTAPGCAIVGSVRRRKPDVGDLELIAPLPEAACRGFDPFEPAEAPTKVGEDEDELYRKIRASTDGEPDLFNPSKPPPVARALEGLKPGFLMCSLVVRLAAPPAVEIPVQVFRYTPGDKGNRGWCELMRTGPGDFGRQFLVDWKKSFNINPDNRASKDGFLVDPHGVRIPTPTEEDCFQLCRRAFVPPEERDEHARRIAAREAREERELWR